MRLYNNRPSPYGRKVLVVVHEKQLLERVNVIQIDPWSDPPELVATTPLGKVPAFITDDGMLVTESTLICEYFDAIGPGRDCSARIDYRRCGEPRSRKG